MTGVSTINRFEYLGEFNSKVIGYKAISIDKYGEDMLNSHNHYFRKKEEFNSKWKSKFLEIYEMAFIVEESMIRTKDKQSVPGHNIKMIDKNQLCRNFAKFIIEYYEIDIEKTFFEDRYPDYTLKYREMLYDICKSIIAPAIFENENLDEKIDEDIICKVYDFLKSKCGKEDIVCVGNQKYMFEVRNKFL